MKKRLQIVFEMAVFLLLCLIIPTVAVLLLQLFIHELPQDIFRANIRGGIFLGLLFCGFPGIVSFYLFRYQERKQRLFVPAVALLLEILWVLLLITSYIDGLRAIIVMFLPTAGIVAATITAARHPRLRNHNLPLKNMELVFVIVIELLFGILIPIFAMRFLGQYC